MAIGLRRPITLLAALFLTLAAAVATLAFQQGTAHAQGASDWTQYAFDTNSSGYNAAETTVTAGNASSLHVDWTASGSVGSTVQPLVVGGTVFWASWDGNLHANSLAGGASLWTTQLGFLHLAGHGPPQAGISSTPVYGSIGGNPVLFVWDGGNSGAGNGEAAAFAVNAETGAIVWRTNVISSSPDVMAWGSVKEFNGALYISTASLDDKPVIPSRTYKLDPDTGAIEASQSIGGGVWGTSTFDPSTGDMFIPVGGPSASGGTNHFQFGIVELDAATLAVVSSWTAPSSQQNGDSDFGSSPTLFTNSSGTPMVGLGGKNGRYYAFDRADIGAGPVWTDAVAVAGNNPNTQGTISPPVFANGTLYVAGADTTVNGASCNGSVRAINPSTGAYEWQFCASGHILGALAGAPGILAVPDGGTFQILSMSSGAVLYSHSAGATIDGAPSIADGHVLYPAMNGSVTVLSPSTTTGNTVTVTSPGSQSTTVGTAVSLQIHASDSASGQTLTYSATGLPAGLSINSATGLISGTPTTAGTANVTVTAQDTTGASGSASFSWTVGSTTGGLTISNLSVADTANASHWSIQSDFTSGATLYGDRTYTVGTVPPQLQGDAWIRDANLSKGFTGNPLVTFTINQAATVYVSVDTRIGERSWMASGGWTNTGATVTDHEGGATRTFDVYSKSYPAGSVSLGPDGDTANTGSTYLIVVK